MKKMKAVFMSTFALLACASVAAAEGAAAPVAAAAAGGDNTKAIIALSAALAIGLAASFGAIAQSKGLSAALDGIARNPAAAGKIQTPMIIGLAMIESLVIYALVIAFMLIGKL